MIIDVQVNKASYLQKKDKDSPLQKFKPTSDFPPSWRIIGFLTHTKRVEELIGLLHEFLITSSTFVNQ